MNNKNVSNYPHRAVASVSFGKDSLAMLLYIIENGLPLDEALQDQINWPMKRFSNQKYGDYGNVHRMAEVFEEESSRR